MPELEYVEEWTADRLQKPSKDPRLTKIYREFVVPNSKDGLALVFKGLKLKLEIFELAVLSSFIKLVFFYFDE